MKTYRTRLLVFVSFMIVYVAFTQNKNHNFKLDTDAFMNYYNPTLKLKGGIVNVPAGAKFQDVQIEKDSVIIRFWNWNASSENYGKYNVAVNSIANERNTMVFSGKEQIYFKMSREDFDNRTTPVFKKGWEITGGTVLLPIKMRFNKFDFSKDFTLGPAAGGKKRLSETKENYLNLLFAFGITSVTLDSASTDGKIKKSSDRPALTPAFGLVFEFSKIQFGAFLGWDNISNKEEANWKYHGKPWLGIGLGYSLLTREDSKKEGENK